MIPLSQTIVPDSLWLIPVAALAIFVGTIVVGIFLAAGEHRAARATGVALMIIGALMPLLAGWHALRECTIFGRICVFAAIPYGALLLVLSLVQQSIERSRPVISAEALAAAESDPLVESLHYWRDTSPDPRPRNVPAIASLLMGMLGCIPFITGLGAVFYGVVGIRRGRDPMLGGRGMAAIGLILGAISVIDWSVVAFGVSP